MMVRFPQAATDQIHRLKAMVDDKNRLVLALCQKLMQGQLV